MMPKKFNLHPHLYVWLESAQISVNASWCKCVFPARGADAALLAEAGQE